MAGVFFVVDVLVSLAIYFVFLGKFRRASDIFGLSMEMKKVGAFFLVALRECARAVGV